MLENMTKTAGEARLAPSENLAIAAAALLIFAFSVVAYYIFPLTYVRLVTEDHWGEWTTFAGFFLAALIFVKLFWNSTPKKTGGWFLLLAIVSFFIAMEEISWGQRLFSLSVPEFFSETNFQNEITLHNIQGFWSNEWTNMRIAGIAFLLYGLVLPMLANLSPAIKELCRKWHFPLPSIGLAPLFALVFVFFIFQPMLVFQELGEMFMALSICMLAVEKWLFRSEQQEARLLDKILNTKGAILLLVAGVLGLVAGFVFSPDFVAGALSADGSLQPHTEMLVTSYRKIAFFAGSFLIVAAVLIWLQLRRGDAQTGQQIGANFVRKMTARKGLTLSAALFFVLLVGYVFMISFGYEIGFKNTLNDFAAQKYYDKGLHEQAEKLYAFIEDNPKYADERMAMFRGRNLLALGEKERGRALLQGELAQQLEASRSQPQALEPVLAIARIHAYSGEKDSAAVYYRRAVDIESANAGSATDRQHEREARMSLGDIYFEIGEYQQALAEFERARDLAANDLQVRASNIRIFHLQKAMNQ